MAKLYLLRHAKAGWAQPGMCDFDRPLDATGREEAAMTGDVMRKCGYQPDLTLCSKARRAQETLEGIADSLDIGRVILLEALYTEDAAFYLETVRAYGHFGSILVIGHNPMMEDLTLAISCDGEPGALDTLNHGFPTAGLAVLKFEGNLEEAGPGKGYLQAFLTPVSV